MNHILSGIPFAIFVQGQQDGKDFGGNLIVGDRLIILAKSNRSRWQIGKADPILPFEGLETEAKLAVSNEIRCVSLCHVPPSRTAPTNDRQNPGSSENKWGVAPVECQIIIDKRLSGRLME